MSGAGAVRGFWPVLVVLAAFATLSATVSACAANAGSGPPDNGCRPAKKKVVTMWVTRQKPYVSPDSAPPVSGFCSPGGLHVGPGRGPDPGPRANANGMITPGSGPVVGAGHVAMVRYIAQDWTGTHVYHNSWAKGSSGPQPISVVHAGRWASSGAATAHVGQVDEYIGAPDWPELQATGSLVMVVQVVGIK